MKRTISVFTIFLIISLLTIISCSKDSNVINYENSGVFFKISKNESSLRTRADWPDRFYANITISGNDITTKEKELLIKKDESGEFYASGTIEVPFDKELILDVFAIINSREWIYNETITFETGELTTVNAELNIVNTSPSCTLTSPTDGASYTAGDMITISADASDSDGSIVSVKFYEGSNLLSTDTSSPYSYNWNPTSTTAGNKTIKAIAIDSDGAETESLVNITVIPEMILIEGGTFSMGNNYFNEGDDTELPVHNVSLSPYYMGIHEVTQLEYKTLIGSNPSNTSYGIGDNHPVNTVSYYDVMVYCNILSLSENLTPCYTIDGSTDPTDWGSIPTDSDDTWDAVVCDFSVTGYRLPTEAEWENAAKGGVSCEDHNRYSGCFYETDLTDYAWYDTDSGETTHKVGVKLPNQLGLYDMSGNLFEWCWDWYASYTANAVTNPTGPASGSSRIIRGGSFTHIAASCRSAYRAYWLPCTPDYKSPFYGFRLVRTAE